MEFKDYYRILGVTHDASPDAIRRAYRQALRSHYPHINTQPEAAARFRDAVEAGDVLKTPEKRAAYDLLLAYRNQDASPSRLPGWWPSGERRAPADARGEDRHGKALIELEDSYYGATRTLAVQFADVEVQDPAEDAGHSCLVTIPRGTLAGQTLRVRGQGAPGQGRGAPGDLLLEVSFTPHPLYRVTGADVFLDVPLAPWEAALGAHIRLPTPTGAVELNVPPRAVAGRTFRLNGRGIPASTPGDFYAVLKIVTPTAGDEQSSFYNAMPDTAKRFIRAASAEHR